MGVHACDPSIQEVEAGGSGVQDHPQLHSEFKASLAYVRPLQAQKQNILRHKY